MGMIITAEYNVADPNEHGEDNGRPWIEAIMDRAKRGGGPRGVKG